MRSRACLTLEHAIISTVRNLNPTLSRKRPCGVLGPSQGMALWMRVTPPLLAADGPGWMAFRQFQCM